MNLATTSPMRRARRAVQVLRYQSARAPGLNLALLACAAFTSTAPLERQVWRVHVGAMGVRAICVFPEHRLAFDRQAFARDPRIAALIWDRPADQGLTSAQARSAISRAAAPRCSA